MNEKEARLRELCARHDADGAWLRRRANVAWLADGADVHVLGSSELGVASLWWSPTQKRVLTDSIEAARLAAEEFSSEWEIVARPWWEPFVPPAGNWLVDWPDDVVAPLRAPLVERELERVRALGRESAECVEALMHDVRHGSSEFEVAADLTSRLLARGIRAPVVLIAADERIARFRHPTPTAKRVERTLMTVLCAERHGLIVCLTRLCSFGALADDLARRHRAVIAVERAMHAVSLPGTSFGAVFAEAQRMYRATGFPDEWKLHHQGGPMGYAARDFCVAPGETRCIVERQLLGWNPSITGTKSEDTLVSGGEVLTRTGKWPELDGRPDILIR
ncbi:MAG: M24 family metallopeptidase [Planctomycetes bacterium]|nr:M24 family metallopeptidase [Planctomycetota bacterium]